MLFKLSSFSFTLSLLQEISDGRNVCSSSLLSYMMQIHCVFRQHAAGTKTQESQSDAHASVSLWKQILKRSLALWCCDLCHCFFCLHVWSRQLCTCPLLSLEHCMVIKKFWVAHLVDWVIWGYFMFLDHPCGQPSAWEERVVEWLHDWRQSMALGSCWVVFGNLFTPLNP